MDSWHSRSTFVLALAAAAVGLGNIWRFAYLLGENGGAPFMLVYLLALLAVAAPLLVAEVIVGNLGRGSPGASLRRAARDSGRSRLWVLIAPLAQCTALLLLAASMVVGAWSLVYAFNHQLGAFGAISMHDTRDFFAALLAAPLRSALWLGAALLPLLLASAAGIRRGVAVLIWIAVPLIMVLLGVLVKFAVEYGDLQAAGRYLFARQHLDFSPQSVLQALAQAVYTLGVGAAVGITFGAYAPGRVPLCRSVLAVALFDSVVAVAVAVAIFPLLFANNLAPAQGIGLLFVALPYAFGNLSLGDFYGTLFFFCVYVVTLATAVALLEPLVSSLQHWRLGRVWSVFLAVLSVWVLGSMAIFSLAPGSTTPGLFAHMEMLASMLLLPLGAFLLALFVGWRVPRATLRAALGREPDMLFSLWYFALRLLVPPALVVVVVWVYLTSPWYGG